MRIEISFYGNLIVHRTEINELRKHIQIPGGMTVSRLLETIEIFEPQIKAVCNGKKTDGDCILQENDYLQLYSLNSAG